MTKIDCSRRWSLFDTSFFILSLVLLLPDVAIAQTDVEGFDNLGRGSCVDSRGKMYTYMQRTMEYPDAPTCASQECARFANDKYRGFEFSVGNRCTCLFDFDIEPFPPPTGDVEYVTKKDDGDGPIGATSLKPGTTCYRFQRNSGNTVWTKTVFYVTTLLSTTIFYLMC